MYLKKKHSVTSKSIYQVIVSIGPLYLYTRFKEGKSVSRESY